MQAAEKISESWPNLGFEKVEEGQINIVSLAKLSQVVYVGVSIECRRQHVGRALVCFLECWEIVIEHSCNDFAEFVSGEIRERTVQVGWKHLRICERTFTYFYV